MNFSQFLPSEAFIQAFGPLLILIAGIVIYNWSALFGSSKKSPKK
jgi:hypothetical protein